MTSFGKLPAALPNETTTLATAYKLLGVSPAAQQSKVSKKHVALKNPEGKLSSFSAAQKALKEKETAKRKRAKLRGENTRGIMPKKQRTARNHLSWDSVQGLHALWLGYMSELLGLELQGAESAAQTANHMPKVPAIPSRKESGDTEGDQIEIIESINRHSAIAQGFTTSQILNWHTKLVKASYLGCSIRVKQSPNSSLVNQKGIIVQDTAGTWSVVTPKSKLKVLPKQNTIFTFALPLVSKPEASSAVIEQRQLCFDLSGSHFAHRPAERVNRKVKARIYGEFEPNSDWTLPVAAET